MVYLTTKKAVVILLILILSSAGFYLFDCILTKSCTISVTLSFISIFYSLIGTIVIATPSILTSLGKNEHLKDGREIQQSIYDGYTALSNGDDLSPDDAGYNVIRNYIRSESDYMGEPSIISTESDDIGITFLSVDGDTLDMTLTAVAIESGKFEESVDNYAEFQEDSQERIFVVLGCLIYGFAILLQSLSTLLSNSEVILI